MALRFILGSATDPRFALLLLCSAAAGCFIDAIGQPSQGGGPPVEGGAGQSSSGSFMQGGGGNGQGGEPSAGAPSGGMNEGGSVCGDGEVTGDEPCDDGPGDDPFDGCFDDCTLGPLAECDRAGAILLASEATIVVTGSTVGSGNDIELDGQFPGLSCQSRGPDAWVGVRLVADGAVQANLQLADDQPWGGSLEKGILQLRTGCDPSDATEVLSCKSTEGGDPEGSIEMNLFGHAGETVYFVVDGRGDNDEGRFTLTVQHHRCGDGVVQPPEQCDDGDDDVPCSGCLLDDPADRCGADGPDTVSFKLAANQHCYVHQTASPNNFFEARERCVEMGGDLATLGFANEKAAFDLARLLPASSWVGLHDLDEDGGFGWLDGGAFTEPWLPPNPDADELCGSMVTDGAAANAGEDTACDGDLDGYVCELRGTNP